MKFWIIEEIGSVAYVRDGKVVYVPLNTDGTFDTDEMPVEHDSDLDDEEVAFSKLTLGELNDVAKGKLGVNV